MKSKLKNVPLSFCCQENWDSFKTINEKSRLCGSCQHKVVDFTEPTQEEFDSMYASGEKVCGRFKASQVNDSFLKLATASLVLIASAASSSCTDEDASQKSQLQNVAEQNCKKEVYPILMGIPVMHEDRDSTHLWVLPKIIPDLPKQNDASHHPKATGGRD